MDIDSRPTAPDPYSLLPEVPSFTVTSESFTDGAALSETHVYDDWGFTGDNRSPQLSWTGAPEGTRSYAVSCFDPDAPTPAGFWHWTVLGIPAEVTDLAEDAGREGGEGLPEGALMTTTDFGTQAFGGAAPPAGDRPHRYVFAVHALDCEPGELGLEGGVSCTVAAFTYLTHTLARATITGTYQTPA